MEALRQEVMLSLGQRRVPFLQSILQFLGRDMSDLTFVTPQRSELRLERLRDVETTIHLFRAPE